MDLLKLKDFYPLAIDICKFLWKSNDDNFKDDARIFAYGVVVLSFMLYCKNSINTEGR